MPLPTTFADPAAKALPLHLVTPEGLEAWRASRDPVARDWMTASAFAAKEGEIALLPGANGALAGAALGLGGPEKRARSRFAVAQAAATLPAGAWHLADPLSDDAAAEAALGWLLAGYRFDRYRKPAATQATAQLVPPANVDAARLTLIAQSEALTRDLINTPAADMGPEELDAVLRALAAEFDAAVTVTTGEELLAAKLPMIHAVGRASSRAPRLIDLRWGDAGPLLTLVGKGVCFDTGGLDIKPASSMGLMKKDMGGAANVIGLARMIMGANWPVRLRVLVPAVENAISGNAFRPQDVLTARNGLTVEVNNTDAEGRLVLADALALAAEEGPDCLISMATLTGAARVALGPDLAPYYTDDAALAVALESAAAQMRDPVWRLPFWTPYESMIEPGIADLDNAPGGGMAGSITAALFLRRFAGTGRYAHFDIYGWQPTKAPARPKGGVGQGARALFAALPGVLSL